jgi:hypothetical protein
MEGDPMKYALLLYADEGSWDGLDAEAQAAVMDEYDAVTEAMKGAGAHLGGEGLQTTSTATTVRVRDGKPIVTDGPFVESKEVIGGFYVVEAPDRDAALQWASRTSAAISKPIEVRPFFASADASTPGRD